VDDPLWRQRVDGESFTGQTWRRAKPTDWTLVATSFGDCRFENVTVSALDIHPRGGRTVFRDCELVDCRLRPHGPAGAGVVGDALSERCRFAGGWWKGWICPQVDCVFALRMDDVSVNADLADPLRRQETGRSRNRVEGNDFSAARLHDFALRGGADVRSQHWNRPSTSRCRRRPAPWRPRTPSSAGTGRGRSDGSPSTGSRSGRSTSPPASRTCWWFRRI